LDCVLSEWTQWSDCSKACDVGFKERRRAVDRPAKGQGGCPKDDSLARLEYMHCNTAKCEPKHDGVLRCMSKLDVVLLLDGSGSVSQEGWDATLNVSDKLVGAFLSGSTGTQVAALLFSGPSSWDGYEKCVSGEGTVDLSADCNMQWASHFTSDKDALASAISGLSWPKGTTMISAALASAASELHGGSTDGREQVVIVFSRQNCPWCDKMKPVLERALIERSKVATGGDPNPSDGLLRSALRVFVIDAGQFASLTQSFGVKSFPTSMFFGVPGQDPVMAEGYLDDAKFKQHLKDAGGSRLPGLATKHYY
jgi:thiol-disulfide isomerase/thioredoxin